MPDTIRLPGAQATSVYTPTDLSSTNSFEKPLPIARRDVLERFERAYLAHHLKECGGRVGQTAKRIGIEPRSLFEKMKQYKLAQTRLPELTSRRRRTSGTCPAVTPRNSG